MNEEFTLSQEELEQDSGRRSNQEGPRKPRRGHWKRAFKWLAVVIVIVVAAAAAFLYFNLSKISVNPFGFGKLKGESTGRVNIMMLGVGDPGHDGENLSDTNILLSIDTVNHKIAVLSIPRDTQVDIPGYGESKINNANAQGGIATAKQVFEDNLGVTVNYYVKANFTGLQQVVDAVGGVDVDNTETLSDPEYPCDNNQYKSCGYKLTPGHYHLNGTEALKFVRCRKGTCGDDFGRAARQQQVMQSIRTKATSAGTLANPIALAKLVNAAGNNVTTDLSANNMLRLQQITKTIAKTDIYDVVLNTETDGFLEQSATSSNLLPVGGDFDEIRTFSQNIFKYAPIWIEHPTIEIQNGTATSGVGSRFKQKISSDGQYISVNDVINAITSDHATSQVIDYSGGKTPNTLKYLKGLLKVTQTTPATTAAVAPADIVVILGADYAATQTAPTPSADGTTTTTPED